MTIPGGNITARIIEAVCAAKTVTIFHIVAVVEVVGAEEEEAMTTDGFPMKIIVVVEEAITGVTGVAQKIEWLPEETITAAPDEATTGEDHAADLLTTVIAEGEAATTVKTTAKPRIYLDGLL